MSFAEARVWNLLRMEPLAASHFRRQVPFGPYYADFASHPAKLIIEIDGSGHASDSARAYDARRDVFLRRQGYRVVRISTVDVLRSLPAVGDLVIALVGAD